MNIRLGRTLRVFPNHFDALRWKLSLKNIQLFMLNLRTLSQKRALSCNNVFHKFGDINMGENVAKSRLTNQLNYLS